MPTPSFTEFTTELAKYPESTIGLRIARGTDTITVPIKPTAAGKIGIQLKPITDVYPVVTRHYNLLQSIPKGWEIDAGKLSAYIGSLVCRNG